MTSPMRQESSLETVQQILCKGYGYEDIAIIKNMPVEVAKSLTRDLVQQGKYDYFIGVSE